MQNKDFSLRISEESIGAAWVSLVEKIVIDGRSCEDEGRKRLAVHNIVVNIEKPSYPDKLLTRYANQKNIDSIIELTFKNDEMYDFDVVPSFKRKSKSYRRRILDGNMLDFVVNRLTLIPESKKAVMVFPTYEDYEAVLANPRDDYLPCIVVVQFRLLPTCEGAYELNTTFFARSIDAYQKSSGNFVAMFLLAEEVRGAIQKEKDWRIEIGSLEGFITDAHIYGETLEEAKRVLDKYRKKA